MAKKKKKINTIPPIKVKQNAVRGLEIRAKQPKSKKAMKDAQGNDSTGVQTARKLIAGRALSIQTIKTMRAWFARHDTPEERANRKNDKTSKAYQSWLAWGGDAGRRWSNYIMDRIEKS